MIINKLIETESKKERRRFRKAESSAMTDFSQTMRMLFGRNFKHFFNGGLKTKPDQGRYKRYGVLFFEFSYKTILGKKIDVVCFVSKCTVLNIKLLCIEGDESETLVTGVLLSKFDTANNESSHRRNKSTLVSEIIQTIEKFSEEQNEN